MMGLAVTGFDGKSRANEDDSDHSHDFRYGKRMRRYAKLACKYGFQSMPLIFSHTD